MSFPTNALFSLIRRRPSATQTANPDSSPLLSPTLESIENSNNASTSGSRNPGSPTFRKVAPAPRGLAPYEVPDAKGRCWLIDLPEEVLVRVFEGVDRVTTIRCLRLCKSLNTFLTTDPTISLTLLLQLSSLRLNPHTLRPSVTDTSHVPPSTADLLHKLRSRLENFATLTPRRVVNVALQEPEGRLYEYLEGVLLRGLGGAWSLPREVAIYDLGMLGDDVVGESDVIANSSPEYSAASPSAPAGSSPVHSAEDPTSAGPSHQPLIGLDTGSPQNSHQEASLVEEASLQHEDEVDEHSGVEIELEADEIEIVWDSSDEDMDHDDEDDEDWEEDSEDADSDVPGDEAAASPPSREPVTEAEKEEQRKRNDLASRIRRTKKFDFEVAEFAVDKGQDLLVIVEVKTHDARRHNMMLHLLSLSTFEPHPRASQPHLEWPTTLQRRKVQLGFQICDDGLFVLNHNIRVGTYDQICGWQWTTGRLAVTLKAFPTMSFESFILLTPTSLLVPTIITHLDPESTLQNDLNNPADLSWSHHLHLYAFPAFTSVPIPTNSAEPIPPPHSVTHIATLDLPEFVIDLTNELPPPRMTIRTDPPPRHTFSPHPVDNVEPFVPEPESGVIILEFFCQTPSTPFPHYVLACPKKTIIRYLPAPTSPMLTQAFPRQAPVIGWNTLAPKVRMFGPDLLSSSWVCYVYQDRYVTTNLGAGSTGSATSKIRLYDFNPTRVKRELLNRQYGFPVQSLRGKSAIVAQSSTAAAPTTTATTAGSSTKRDSPPIAQQNPKRRSILRRLSSSLSGNAEKDRPPYDGERSGITLMTGETVIKKQIPLMTEIRTGRDFPYMYVEKRAGSKLLLLDEQRIIAVHDEDSFGNQRRAKARLEIMEF